MRGHTPMSSLLAITAGFRRRLPARVCSSGGGRDNNVGTLINFSLQYPKLPASMHDRSGYSYSDVNSRVLKCNDLNRQLRSFCSSSISSCKDVECSTRPTSVPVRAAYDLLQAGHRYLDVRTVEEFNAGHVIGSINVPYMLRVRSDMIKNPNFLEEVLAHFRTDDEIIVGCKSGRRSLMAAADLLSAGFTTPIDMAGGYTAWTQLGLPIHSQVAPTR